MILFVLNPSKNNDFTVKSSVPLEYQLYMCVQSYLTLCNSVDWSLPGSSVHGILQARILEWVSISSSRGSSWPRDQTHTSFISLQWQADSSPLSNGGSPIYQRRYLIFI